MAIRQRIWQIYTRPSIILENSNENFPDTTIVLSEKTIPYMSNIITKKKEKIKVPENSNGIWIKVFESNSYDLICSRINQLLPSCPRSSIKIMEAINTDFEVIPQD